MPVSRAVLVSAKIAAAVGAVFIGLAAPAAGLAASVTADGGTSQTPVPARNAGDPWGG
jgi:hypothetical protein